MYVSAHVQTNYSVLEESERQQYLRLAPYSPPLHVQYYHEDDKRADSTRLPPAALDLFQGALLPSLPQQSSPHTPPSLAAAVLFAGGSVWALDLLRPAAAPGAARPPALLALAANSSGAEETRLGARIGGHCAVQALALPAGQARAGSLERAQGARRARACARQLPPSTPCNL